MSANGARRFPVCILHCAVHRREVGRFVAPKNRLVDNCTIFEVADCVRLFMLDDLRAARADAHVAGAAP